MAKTGFLASALVGVLCAACGGPALRGEAEVGGAAPSCIKEWGAPPPGVLSLTEDMTAPENVSTGTPIVYGPKAFAAKLRGPVRARCVITEQGSVRGCRIFQAPGMEAAIVNSLESRGYRPATLAGRPVAVDYPLEFFLEPPPTPGDSDLDTNPLPGSIAFNKGMTLPRKISGGDPQYTREALKARVQGRMVTRCVITTEGEIKNCRVLRPLPCMEQAVLDALQNRRYTPILYDGRPVSVTYVFQINFVLPDSR